MEKKFRMYSGPRVNKYFYDQAQVLECMTQQVSGLWDHEKENGAVFEQWTGLYDSTTWEELTEEQRDQWTIDGNMPSEWKGCPLYENDLLNPDDEGCIAIISFENGIFGYRWIGSNFRHLPLFNNIEEMKLAGNKNQHPELLNQEK
jgi:hypothetical protein